jgi:hypothetical protein
MVVSKLGRGKVLQYQIRNWECTQFRTCYFASGPGSFGPVKKWIEDFNGKPLEASEYAALEAAHLEPGEFVTKLPQKREHTIDVH